VTDPTPPAGDDLAPPDYCDPVIEAYKKDVDRTLLRENLKLTVEERIRKAESFHRAIDELRGAADRARRANAPVAP
jgi:hypothetical protein